MLAELNRIFDIYCLLLFIIYIYLLLSQRDYLYHFIYFFMSVIHQFFID